MAARHNHGLTLIELITAIAIVAILAAIAWPAFESQLLKNRRTEAVNALMQASQELHQCRTDNGDYNGCTLSFSESEEDNYTIARTDSTQASQFTVTATFQGEDPQCATLTIDHLGRKGHTGTATDSNTCWGE